MDRDIWMYVLKDKKVSPVGLIVRRGLSGGVPGRSRLADAAIVTS